MNINVAYVRLQQSKKLFSDLSLDSGHGYNELAMLRVCKVMKRLKKQSMHQHALLCLCPQAASGFAAFVTDCWYQTSDTQLDV